MFSEMKILTYWHVYNINIIKSLKTIPPSGGSQIYQATVDDEKCLDCAGLGWWWLVVAGGSPHWVWTDEPCVPHCVQAEGQDKTEN